MIHPGTRFDSTQDFIVAQVQHNFSFRTVLQSKSPGKLDYASLHAIWTEIKIKIKIKIPKNCYK